MVAQDLGAQRNSVPGRNGPVGPDFQRQLVEVAGGTHTGRLHSVVDLLDRGIDGIHGNGADDVLRGLIPVGGHIAPTMGEGDLHVQRGTAVQRRNVQIRIQDLHLTVGLNVAGGNCAGTHRLDIDGLAGITMELGQQALDVQNDLRHILLDAGDGGKLVLHTVDLDGRRRSAGQRGKQNAAQGVAEGGAIAALQRLYHVLAISDVSRGLDALDLGLLNFDHAVTLLHLVIAVTRSSRVPLAVRTILRGYPPNYLEYNSTMRCSSTGVSISSRVGR